MNSFNFILIFYWIYIKESGEAVASERSWSNYEAMTGDSNRGDNQMIQETDIRYNAFKHVARFLNSTMNLELDPCNGFYEFTCGNYYVDGILAQDLFTNLMKTALQLEEKEYLSSKAPAAVQKLAKVYEACRSETANVSDYSKDEDFLKQVIDEFREKSGLDFTMLWNQNDTEKRIGQTIDKDRLAKALTALSILNTNTLISPVVQADWRNPSSYILHLNQFTPYIPAFLYRDSQWPRAATILKPRIAKLLNQTAALYSIKLDQQRLRDDVDVLLQFEKDLVQKYTVNRELSDPAVYNRIYNLFKVKDIRGKYPFLNFDYYLANLAEKLPELETYFDDERTIVINQPDLLERLSNGFANMNHDVLANYFYLRLVEEFPISYKEEGFKPCPIETRLQCIGKLSYFSSEITTRVYLDSIHPDKTERKDLLDYVVHMAEKIRENVVAIIGNLNWSNGIMEDFALKKVANAKINVGYEKEIDDDEQLNLIYDGVDFQENAGYKSMAQTFSKFNRWSFFKRMSQHQNVPTNEFRFPPIFERASYVMDANTLEFPIGFIDQQINRNWPSSIKYAGLGSAIAQEFVPIFAGENAGFDYSGMLTNETFTETLRQNLSSISSCLVEQYNEFCVNNSSSNETVCQDGEATFMKNLANNIGLNAAWMAYNEEKSLKGADLRLPDSTFSKFSNDELFFIWYGNTRCVSKQLYQDKVNALPDFRVLGQLQNLKGFRETFQCNVPSVYAPQERCELNV